ncbi:MAG: hypothetical protein ACPG19_13610 [Saprospiraceae bacterium]
MKYPIVVFCLSLLFITSCNSEKKEIKKISLFNGIKVQLLDGENSQAAITDTIQSTFKKYTSNNTRISIPLFKYIEHTDYSLFIGIPVDARIKDFSDSLYHHSNEILIEEKKESKTEYFRQYQLDNTFISEMIIKEVGSTLLFLAVTKNKDISNRIFNHKSFSSRVEKK